MSWINVKDSLPDFHKEVLVLGEQIGMNPQMGGAYHVITRRIDSKGTALANERIGRYMCENNFKGMRYVTYWMYLPEKP